MGIEVKRKVEETTEVTCDVCGRELTEKEWDYERSDIDTIKQVVCKACHDAMPTWMKEYLMDILNAESTIPIRELNKLNDSKVYVLFGGKEDGGLFFSCDSVDEAKKEILEIIGQSGDDRCWFDVIVIDGKPYAQIEMQVRIKGYDEVE